MDVTTFVRPIIELGFPVVVAIYLLLVQSKQLDRFSNRLGDLKIGMYLILAKLDAIEEYEKALEAKEIVIVNKKKEENDR